MLKKIMRWPLLLAFFGIAIVGINDYHWLWFQLVEVVEQLLNSGKMLALSKILSVFLSLS